MDVLRSNAVLDPVELAAELIRRPSVTPKDEGAIPYLAAVLEKLGFGCEIEEFTEPGTEPVLNLYARIGKSGRNFCFAGHTDVVPPGNLDAWTIAPFSGTVTNDALYGRGATDMKGAIACFAVAAARFLTERGREFGGSISLLITGDEEGVSINGTKKLLDWLAARGETLDACIVGVIPGRARAVFNIRYNDRWSSASLTEWLKARLDAVGGRYTLDIHVSGESFLVPPGEVSKLLTSAIERVTGRTPELSTTGGTSDARFIHHHCPLAEFGLVGLTMHKVDERVALADMSDLTEIYRTVLELYFPRA